MANLFEHSRNIVPIDGQDVYWRVHRIVDNQIKFYAPTPDAHGCFRQRRPFSISDNTLNPNYIEIVTSGQNCIVTSHDLTLAALQQSDCQQTLTDRQIKVLIRSHDSEKNTWRATTKNLLPKKVPAAKSQPDPSKFDHVIDIDQMQLDWQTCKDFVKDLGLDLDHKHFVEYQDLLAGHRTHMTHNYNVEIYKSRMDGDNILYELQDIHQPTL